MSKNKPRICLVSFPMATFWVVEVFVSDLIRILTPLADKVYLIAKNRGYYPENNITEIIDVGSTLEFFCPTRSKSLYTTKYLLNILIIELKMVFGILSVFYKTDIVILYVGGIYLLLPMLIAKLLKKKVVFFAMGRGPKATGLSFKISNLTFINNMALILATRLNLLLYYLANKIVLESPAEIHSLGYEKYLSKLDYNGARYVDIGIFRCIKEYDKRPAKIGYLSRLSADKGILNLIESVPIVLNKLKSIDKSFIFEIYGEGNLKADIAAKIRDMNLEDIIFLRGKLASSECVAAALNEFKLFVLPSNIEGLPTIILESMACGTPVLATSVGSIPHVIDDEVTGFIMEKNSPDHISENIIRALNNINMNNIINNSTLLISSNYTYDAAVERYKDILSI